jgi:hypothetical protein
MSRSVECFLIVPTGLVKLQLRRYRGSSDGEKCPGPFGYHNGHADFGKIPAVYTDRGTLSAFPQDQVPAHDDHRWAQQCDDCTYRFTEQDEWQVFQEHLYHRPGVDEELTLRDPPHGAMWDCTWFPTDSMGPDGKCLCIMTPGGQWMPDLPSSDGKPWTRTGTVPKITVRPSILINARGNWPGYHGFLTDGVLVDC